MAYAPIAKLDNFMAIQAIPYFLKDTADSWYQSLINKPQDFNAFKVEFLRYFSNNNSINPLVNAFTTMKQGETEAILNQFIHGLRSSILQHVRLLHPGTLQDAVTHARDFESAESEANHAQAVNLVMNGSSELDSKLEKFSESINKRLERYLTDNYAIYQPPQRRNNQGNSTCGQNQPCLSSSTNQQWQQETHICHYCVLNSKSSIKLNTISNYLSANDTAINLLTTSISSANLSTNDPNLSAIATDNVSTITANNLSTPNNLDPTTKLTEDASPSNQKPTQKQQTCTSNIPSATVTNNKSLDAIFPFELEEPSNMSLFSGAVLEEKPITAMYTDVKINGHHIKLILNSGSVGSIITQQLMNQLGCRVD
ncbi:hypothetical protein G9A89_021237 [Geosiphon pyriformis]|nr:hypothetical protein G9A89_021237 [Geosiphon pyriformis]